jgi:hypothetical protein
VSNVGPFDLKSFWRWDSFEHYGKAICNKVRFLVGMSAIFAISTTILSGFMHSVVYGELIGYLSLSIEVHNWKILGDSGTTATV